MSILTIPTCLLTPHSALPFNATCNLSNWAGCAEIEDWPKESELTDRIASPEAARDSDQGKACQSASFDLLRQAR
jgi:hypothetical protein